MRIKKRKIIPMPEPRKPKNPLKEKILFFSVFSVIGLMAFSFPLFARLAGMSGAVVFLLARHFLAAGLIAWAGWRFFRWLRGGGEDRRDR